MSEFPHLFGGLRGSCGRSAGAVQEANVDEPHGRAYVDHQGSVDYPGVLEDGGELDKADGGSGVESSDYVAQLAKVI